MHAHTEACVHTHANTQKHTNQDIKININTTTDVLWWHWSGFYQSLKFYLFKKQKILLP